MSHPLRSNIDSRPYALRPHRLPRMGRQTQPGSLRLGIQLAKQIGPTLGFIPTNPNSHDAWILRPQLRRLAKHPCRLLHPKVPHRIDDPQNRSPELLLAANPPPLNRLDVGLNLGLLPVVDNPEGDIDLGMDNTLRSQLPNHVI